MSVLRCHRCIRKIDISGMVSPPATSEAGARWPRRGGTNSTKYLIVLIKGPHDHGPGSTYITHDHVTALKKDRSIKTST
jgi:hypothetical protein